MPTRHARVDWTRSVSGGSTQGDEDKIMTSLAMDNLSLFFGISHFKTKYEDNVFQKKNVSACTVALFILCRQDLRNIRCAKLCYYEKERIFSK